MSSRGRGLAKVLMVALLMAASLQFAAPAQAKTFTVCPSGCNFTTIAAALQAAGDGDSISIGAGTYAGGIDVTKDVTLRGSGRDTTTIQGTNSASVVRVRSGASVAIVAMTIRGGGGSETGGFRSGGGILNEGKLTLTDSIVRDNTAVDGRGGGLYSHSTKNLQIFNSAISDNTAANGGGIFVREGDVFIADSNISRNQSTQSGGGLRHEGGERTRIENTTISDNRAGRFGGGVSVGAALILIDSTVSRNTALFGGGLAGGTKVMEVINTVINDNDAGDGLGGGIFVGDGGARLRDTRVGGNEGESGAGIHTVAGDVKLTGSTIALNVAADEGGGIFNSRAAITMFSSEVVSNQAGVRGGGIFVGRGGSLRLADTLNTISGNQPDQCFGATC